MLRTLIFLTLSTVAAITISSCLNINAGSAKNQNEFEGVITYHEIDKSTDGRINLDDTLQLYYSHGNFVKIHLLRSPEFHPLLDYYLAAESLRLTRYSNSDSLYKLDLQPPFEKLVSFNKKKSGEKILSRNCEEIDMVSRFDEKDSISYTDFKLFFSPGFLPINQEHFKNWHLGNFNKFVANAGAFYLKFQAIHYDSSHKNIVSQILYDAISVKQEPVDTKLFEIDRNKIKSEY